MTENTRYVRRRLAGMVQMWQSFWFEPQQMYVLGLVRIAFGGLAVLWGLWLLSLRHGLLDSRGAVPAQPSVADTWGIFAVWNSNHVMLIGVVVLVLSAGALMVGWHSRVAAVVVFVLVLSFERRVAPALNAGDVLVRIEALFVAVSPCGAALSLDQRRRTGFFWSAQAKANWPIRLIQVQMSLIYLAAARSKLAGETWLNGTAASYALRIDDMRRVPLPQWFVTNALAMNMMTWGTIAIELAVALLVWLPRFRACVLAGGVLLHLMIDVHIQIGIFSYATFVMYLAWLSPETVKQLPDKLRHTLNRRGRNSDTHPPDDIAVGESTDAASSD